ncbi:MAG: hypothetical protein ACYCSQ_00465 [bacterium]
MENEGKLIFKSLNLELRNAGNGSYFVEDRDKNGIYLTADDIDRLSAVVRFEQIERLKDGYTTKMPVVLPIRRSA